MNRLCSIMAVLSIASAAVAAPNITNVTQKGSVLIFPDIRVDNDPAAPLHQWNTLIRIQNDGNVAVRVKCYWMDGNKHRINFLFTLTTDQPVWFDARTGSGSINVSPFPFTSSNGFDNPYLVTPPAASEATDTDGLYRRGMLACWVVDTTAQTQVRWNHLSGTATIWSPDGAYEYNAYAIFGHAGIGELAPIGTPGVINLNGLDFDSCPLYQVGQFSPDQPYVNPAPPPNLAGVVPEIEGHRLVLVACTLDLTQDWQPVFTKLDFDVWNSDEVKYTGAFECADSWHETEFTEGPTSSSGGGIDAAQQNFKWSTLRTYSSRYRVQGNASTRCPGSQSVGVLGVQMMRLAVDEVIEPIYDIIPPPGAGPVPPNVISQPYNAFVLTEVGDHIQFAPGPRVLVSGSFLLSSWACETGHWSTGDCVTTSGATFTHPITLNIYRVAPGGGPGPLLASVTETFTIPFRPSDDPINCPALPDGTVGWYGSDLNCYSGIAVPITFDLTGLTVPDEIIWGIAFGTTNTGYPDSHPNCGTPADCPYNSLNLGTDRLPPMNPGPTIGVDVNPTTFFLAFPGTGLIEAGAPPGEGPLGDFVATTTGQSVGTTLTNAGKMVGTIRWNPGTGGGIGSEGGIR